MEDLVIGWLTGNLCGVLLGAIMLFTRDGIWPQVWVGLIIAFGVLGALFGAFNWSF